MANNYDSNFSTKIAKGFLSVFNSMRTLSKNVNTQRLDGKFNPASGDKIYFRRQPDYVTVRTDTGDISGEDPSPIIVGRAEGVVQKYFTEWVEFDEADEAIKMDSLPTLLAPLATRMCVDVELDFGGFMTKNTALIAGDYGSPATTWDEIAEAGAMMQATGIPMDSPWFYSCNPFTQRKLASNQRALGAGGVAGGLIKNAHEKATIVETFAGFDRVMTATTLSSVSQPEDTDKTGSLTAAPDPTYVGAKDTMTQVLTVTGFNAGVTTIVQAGSVVAVAGRYRLNLSTRQLILDEVGNRIPWTATVLNTTTLTSGAGTLLVTGPAIWEAGGAFNTVDSALISGDVIFIRGTPSKTVQPNLFWHKEAFSIGSVPIKRLYSTDTFAQTKDGLQFRVSKWSDGLKNVQRIRIDFRPAYAVLNPFYAGQGWGKEPV